MLAVTMLALGLVGGCGGGDEDKSKPASDAATATPAISSGVEGVPVPRDSHRNPEAKDTWEVLGMTFDEVVDWYDARLPEGKDFRGWRWCDTGEEAENPTRTYSKGAKTLSITILDDTPPGLLIRVKSGSC